MKMLAFDNETELITRLKPSPPVVCTTFSMGGKPWIEHAKFGDLESIMLNYLKDPEIHFVGHNVAYDFCTLIATFPDLLIPVFDAYRANRVTDTAVRQQLWAVARGVIRQDDEIDGYSLAGLVKAILEEDMAGKDGEDSWRLRYGELMDVELEYWPEEALRYALSDADYTYKVWEAQLQVQDEIHGEHEKTFDLFCLSFMQNRGQRTNAAAVAAFEKRHRGDLADVLPELVQYGLVTVDKKGKATKKKKPAQQRIENACNELGIQIPRTKPSKKFPNGQTSVNKVACLKAKDGPMLKLIDYSLSEKMLSTYLPVVQAGINGPVTTRFKFAGTFRTTSSTPSKPLLGGNFQNAPREGGLRECFEPRKGFVYMASDYSGAELHTLAQACKNKLGYSVLGDKLLSKKSDVHSYLGSKLLSIDEPEFLEWFRGDDKELRKIAEDARQDAKAGNFGFPGGMHERGFINDQLKKSGKLWSYSDAKNLRETWLETFHEMPEYLDYCKAELGPAEDAVIIINLHGTLRRVQTLNQLANSYFQAPAAAGALAAVREATYRCFCVPTSALYGCFPVNFIHDELMLEVPDHYNFDIVADEKKRLMQRHFNKSTPDYPVEVEPVVMARWSKKAKPTFNEAGELIPWV